jgi:hypothetical protein
MLPAWDDHLLPAGQASSSTNGYLFSGALDGWRKPKVLRDLNSGTSKMVYRVPIITSATAYAMVVFLARPNLNDTVTIGEETYTFVDSFPVAPPPPALPPPTAFLVLRGATAITANQNLFNAITTTGDLTTFGTGTQPNPAVDTNNSFITTFSGNPCITVLAPDIGAAYNTTTVAESTSAARIEWLFNGNPTTTYQGGANAAFDSTITGATTWLEFDDADTNVMRSPVLDDSFDRYYFASPSQPPKYNTHARIAAGQPHFLLGIPAPGCAPVVDVTEGGNNAVIGFSNSVSSNSFGVSANSMYLVPIIPTGAMTLNDVSFFSGNIPSTARIAAVLYDDSNGVNGVPNNLLNTGAVITGGVTSPFAIPTGLLANVQYWIGFVTDTAFSVQKADDFGTQGVSTPNTFSNGPPVVAPSMTSGQPNLQIWGDVTTSAVLEARSYVYTWVSAYGEEGPPSPPTLVNAWSNSTWTISLYTPVPEDMGVVRNIAKTRIYRTVSGTTGVTVYFLVAEVPVTQLQYIDTIDDSIIAAANQLESTLWFEPPVGLQGIVAMPNGMAVGFKGNELWFCEPFRPHAWPPSYVLTTEFPIVGIGVTGQSVVAATSGNPYLAQGVNPNSMSEIKTAKAEPCSSRGSVLGTTTGVYYASPNGLILVTQDGTVTNTTELWITREKWQALTSQKNLRAVMLVSCYFAFGSTNGTDATEAKRGFVIELASGDAASFTIWPQPGGHRIGFNELTSPNGFNIDNLLIDPWTGTAMVVQNGQVFYYDFSDQAPTITPYKWRSKLLQQTAKKNLAAFRVFFKVPPGAPVQNPIRQTNQTTLQTLQADQYGIVRVYAGGRLIVARELRHTGELMRIDSGFKHETWQFELEGRVPIYNLQAATSVSELRNV